MERLANKTIKTLENLPSLLDFEHDPIIDSSNRFDYLFPHARRDKDVHMLYNNKAAMLPELPMLYGMKRDDFHTRRESQRSGFQEQTSLYLDVVCKVSKELVCVAGFRTLDNENECAEWGIIVVPEWRQCGVASEVFLSNIYLLKKFNKDDLGSNNSSMLSNNRNIIYREIKASTLPLNRVMIDFLGKRGLGCSANQITGDEWLRFSGKIDIILSACINKNAVPLDDSTKIEKKK